MHIRGDVGRFTTILDGVEQVLEYDVKRLSDDEFYCYIHNETTAVDGALFAAFTRESVVQISPIEYHDDGRATFAVVGPSAEPQDPTADAPPGIDLRVERIGDGAFGRAVTAGLSERQRAAAVIAVELGYYDVPRRASHEDVAAALDCAPSTAAEHLRKAKLKVFTASFS
ncbi:helix-turn-helix domain-containing protein [Haladaptatus pallidirubidus]|uniref:helix-turn-helix domain-containing protein n=1 Tax=Haladaptatus pallidirubidus TaxID=1008152 RepID=UPI003F5FCEEA